MFKIFLTAAIASLAITTTVSAAQITWNAPQGISGTSDVNNSGTAFGSWRPGLIDTTPVIVNGVSFSATPTIPGLAVTGFDSFGGFFEPALTSNSIYNDMLQYGNFTFAATPADISWNGMTPGQLYLVQLWVSDARAGAASRFDVFSGSGSDSSANVLFHDGTGDGQYITGTFVADGTGAQQITINGNESSQFNLIQVRTVVPEPSTLALLSVGLLALPRLRRNAVKSKTV